MAYHEPKRFEKQSGKGLVSTQDERCCWKQLEGCGVEAASAWRCCAREGMAIRICWEGGQWWCAGSWRRCDGLRCGQQGRLGTGLRWPTAGRADGGRCVGPGLCGAEVFDGVRAADGAMHAADVWSADLAILLDGAPEVAGCDGGSVKLLRRPIRCGTGSDVKAEAEDGVNGVWRCGADGSGGRRGVSSCAEVAAGRAEVAILSAGESSIAPRRRPREGVAEKATRPEVGDAPPPQQTQPLPQDAHSGIVLPPPPPPQAAQGVDMTHFLEGMAQFVAQHRDAPVPQGGTGRVLREFLQFQPPQFLGQPDPNVARAWLDAVEQTFRSMECVPEERVLLASYQLQA
ncbi:hypothetical protein Taro_023893 [Colocasia esculenta]|uniref:Uncharacterized protein n=1 Tax=Colocasia esculenta TaxID=4460 RepID=A0A843V5C4_COLES|nr:hypothetical protein [Colocasia esculenta]